MRRRLVQPQESSISDLLARAREIGPRLGSVTDELNASLIRTEEALASLKLGVTASVIIEEEDLGDAHNQLTYLTFGKDGGGWRLLIERGVDAYEETWTTMPLVNASRETRLLASKHLQELLEKLIEHADEQIELVRAQAVANDEFVASIKGAKVPK